MVKEGDLVAIFHSIHRVMKAEKILKQHQVDILLIPVPRELTADCGLAIRLAPELRDEVWQLLEPENLLPTELHQRHVGGYRSLELF